MSELTKITQAQLQTVLSGIIEPSRRRLPDEEYACLAVLFKQMQDRYPSQDLENATEGYLADFEQLATKYSLVKVQRALTALRIRPGQKFFPRPDEVAEEIEDQRERRLTPSMEDTAAYFSKLDQWKQEHAEYMAELQEKELATREA